MKLTNETIIEMCKDKLDGMTLEQIAEKYDVSVSTVQNATPRVSKERKRWYRSYIYPNIVAWMIRNGFSADEFAKHLYMSKSNFYCIMIGKIGLHRGTIDRILTLTEMTYDEAFKTRDDICKEKGDGK